MDNKEDMKLAIISGAAHAVRYKEKNPRASEQEVIKYITHKVLEILDKIDRGESDI